MKHFTVLIIVTITVFQSVLAQDIMASFAADKKYTKEISNLKRDKNVKEALEIIDILEASESITFLELFSDIPDKHEIIVTFLAILEMVKLTLIRIFQHVQTGVIRIFYL